MSSRFGKVLQNFGKLPVEEAIPAPPEAAEHAAVGEGKRIGRPAGKKSNPDYSQVTVYIRKNIHLAAKKALLDDGREFSELVDELVRQWVETSKSSAV